MKRFMAIAFVFTLLAIPAMSQQSTQQQSESKCTLTLAKSLVIRGIRLGMSSDELLTLFPGARENERIKGDLENGKKPASLGQTRFYLSTHDKLPGEQFEGITYIGITLLDDRIVGYHVQYNEYPNGPRWNSIDAWITKLSETLRLPESKDWVMKPGHNSRKTLQCNGFEIEAFSSNGGGIEVFTRVENQVEERLKAHQEKKRREFKP